MKKESNMNYSEYGFLLRKVKFARLHSPYPVSSLVIILIRSNITMGVGDCL